MFKAISLTIGQAGEFWWGLKHTGSGQHEAPEPKEVLGHNTFKCLWKKIMTRSMIAVEKKKQVDHGLEHAQSSLSWALHPLQCKKHIYGKQQVLFCFVMFCFLLSYWKPPNTELAQFGCWFTSSESPITWSYLYSHSSKCWNLYYRRSPVQVFSSCEMLHSLPRFLGLLLESELSPREEGREEAICLLTCDMKQGLLALPAG